MSFHSIDELLQQAMTLTPEERIQFIMRACDTDAGLRESALHRLLSSPSSSSEDSAPLAPFVSSDQPGQCFGPYRILRSLGHGGMGEVFLAERADHQYRQLVAIKLVRGGLVSKSVQNRLRLERQILATLDHPNIARLLDGGTTADGMPYIVMEYVDGEPIDVYCDRLELTIKRRLQLFMRVCSAVHRAHQNLVVHRDLKPSNILVTADGEPKLLDFGIAKVLDERERMHTLAVTQIDVRVMTPDHASPEQVMGEAITTASDIYVLGVLLYELLTGCKPFAMTGNRLADLERAICETDPLSPSVAIAALARSKPEQAEQVAKARGSSIAKLRRELSGDLDNIVLMAMRKEPEKRYSSAERLAADVNRTLQELPVTARPVSWAYRATKFVRRNTLLVSLSTVLLLALIGFSVSTYVQGQRVKHERDAANAAREKAQLQQQRAEAVSSFLIDSFKVADPAEARGREISARDILDSGAIRIQNGLTAHPDLQATLLDTIGNVYLNLGLPSAAQPLVQRGLEIRKSLYGAENLEVASSLGTLNRILEAQGQLQQAESLAREGLAMNQKLSGPASLETADSWYQLGLILYKKYDLSAAEDAFNNCLRIRRARVGDVHELIAEAVDSLAVIAAERRDFGRAVRLYRQVLKIDRQVNGESHPNYILHAFNLASVLKDNGNLQEALLLCQQAAELAQKVLGHDHPETISGILSLGQIFLDLNDLDSAETIFKDVLARDQKISGLRSERAGFDLSRLGRVAYLRGDYPLAQQRYQDALSIYREVLPASHPYAASANLMLGRILIVRKMPAEAEKALQTALDGMRINFGEDSVWAALTKVALARTWAMQGRLRDAESMMLSNYPKLASSKRAEDREMAAQGRGWIEDLFRAQKRPEAAREYFATVDAQ